MAHTLPDFNFDLPDHLIAQTPASPRDAAKLLVLNKSTGQITDAIFRDIDKFLPAQTTIVLNNTKVDKCRLRFGNLEIFVLEVVNNKTVRALIKPGPKFKLGRTVQLAKGIEAEVMAIDEEGIRTLVFNCPLDEVRLDPYRLTPLPPYITQDESLAEEYQTVYAATPGSKAAPTAGLHFTPELLSALKQSHAMAEITLDVGLGTFAPIKADSLVDVHLHRETYFISDSVVPVLNAAQHITAVGTTTVRTLESAIGDNRHFEAMEGSTDIFIHPGYQFKAVDALVTNFHLPGTSLLMLVAAIIGRDELMRCYQHAIANNYRFYSFGDAMLIV